MAHIVANHADRNRYVISTDDGEAGFAEYRIDGDTIVFTHTVIDPEKRERGLASELVQFALDDVRATSTRRVVAECPYVTHWLDEHPEYQDLLER
ncbi:MAG: GNAT family N-acetyltransferase [Microbacteriaceae bacterium]